MSSARPNFFIVGAPKCGTTSMHEYLAQHPQILMARIKEPHYFGRDIALPPHMRIADERKYLALFSGGQDKAVRGESSTWYLYSQQAAGELKSYAPDAKILIMLRNPVDAMYSLHGQFLYSGNEDLADFAAAFDAQADRRAGRRIPALARNPKGLLYRDVFSYFGQVQRYSDTFGRDNVHVILFDDFVADTPAAYRAALRFLGVDETFIPDFKVANWAKSVRVPAMVKVGLKMPAIKHVYHRLVPVMWRGRIVDAMAWAARSKPRPGKIDPALRQRLAPLFAEEVTRLSDLLGRDLSHWTTAAPATVHSAPAQTTH